MLNNKLSNYIKQIFVIAISLVISSCVPRGANFETLDPNLYDQSWLTGKPCGAPCWYGLEPGVSSHQDSISRVNQLSFINGNTAVFTDPAVYPYIDGVSFQYKKPQDFYYVGMYFEKGILEDIDFSPSYQITFEQAVEKLGSPDGFWVLPNEGDAAGCELQVIWKNKRLVLQYDTGILPIISFGLNENLCSNEGNQPLPKGIVVQYVKIMSASDIESILQDNPLNPWKGFAN